MHFGLTDEQQMIVDTVRSFVENEIYPHEDLVERTGEVTEEIAQDIKQKTIDLGFYACNFPESVGCAGLSHLEFALVERVLGRGSMAVHHLFGVSARAGAAMEATTPGRTRSVTPAELPLPAQY